MYRGRWTDERNTGTPSLWVASLYLVSKREERGVLVVTDPRNLPSPESHLIRRVRHTTHSTLGSSPSHPSLRLVMSHGGT